MLSGSGRNKVVGPRCRDDDRARHLSRILDFPPWSGGVRSEHHAAERMVVASMLARASAGVR
jgi:hypothetical protein